MQVTCFNENSYVDHRHRYAPITEADFYPSIFNVFYPRSDSQPGSPEGSEPSMNINHHSLSILFMMLSLGTLLDLERPPHSPEAMGFYHLGRAALSIQNVLEEQSIRGIQALVRVTSGNTC